MNIDRANIPNFDSKEVSLPDAPFLHVKPDFEMYKNVWREFGGFKNILVIGHGGSATSFKGIFSALGNRDKKGEYAHSKNVFFLSTTDPEYIAELKQNLNRHDTLVIAISKSGETVTQIEALLQFVDYPLLFVAGENSPLEEIGKKLKAKIYKHPDVGGRYTAFTEVGMIPAAVCGIEVEGLFKGAAKEYETYFTKENLAMLAAQTFFKLEQSGYVDVFMPFYSSALYGFSDMIVQLCHESFGKNGKGQTYFAHQAPESQHHTNQRFFGGRKDIAGFFIWTDQFRQDFTTNVPEDLRAIPFKDQTLETLDQIPLSYSMNSEFSATYADAKIHSIPTAALEVNLRSAQDIGAFIAFWQIYAVYSSVLREVNPFDQPQVESSKKISWNSRKTYMFK